MTSDQPRDGDHPDEAPPAQGGDWLERRAALDKRIGEQRARIAVPESTSRSRSGGMQGMAQGLKVASEFVAGVAVGALLGYGFDYLLGTGPFGLIFFLMVGFAAGVLNVIRGVGGASAGPFSARSQDRTRTDGE